MSSNPYLNEVVFNLPRIMSMFDSDQTSISYGMGDRYHWAWGLIDFGNGTFQGAAHGMARLWQAGLWPYPTSAPQFLSRIDAMFDAASKLTRKDGSLEEAFPNEGSYCVTALVAFDLICALDLLCNEVDKSRAHRWREVISPLVAYLKKADETHALISNHLATAVAALTRWHRLTRDDAAESRAKKILDRILRHQSNEGWFREYEGADPGYQSLCTYYMADVHLVRPDWNLIEPLRRSIRFLWYFAHPDGSFGGTYGSRCTRFYYPAGILSLASEIPEAAALSKYMCQSIQQQRVVTLSAIDEPNLIPTFNAYCWAAVLNQKGILETPILPALDTSPMRLQLPKAGFLIDRGVNHYTIIATNKGGVTYHFVKSKAVLQDSGLVVRNAKNKLGSTQHISIENKISMEQNSLGIESSIWPMPKQLPNPVQFTLLRLCCISLFRSFGLREWVKKRLVRLLITGAKPWPIKNWRTISMGEQLKIVDESCLPPGYERVHSHYEFVPIHMASQGYWQIQDEEERA